MRHQSSLLSLVGVSSNSYSNIKDVSLNSHQVRDLSTNHNIVGCIT